MREQTKLAGNAGKPPFYLMGARERQNYRGLIKWVGRPKHDCWIERFGGKRFFYTVALSWLLGLHDSTWGGSQSSESLENLIHPHMRVTFSVQKNA